VARFRVYVVEIPPSAGGGTMVIIADEELVHDQLGEDGKDTILPKHLLQGEVMDEVGVAEEMLVRDVILLYGERSIGIAQALGLAQPGTERIVKGVPHLQVFKFRVA